MVVDKRLTITQPLIARNQPLRVLEYHLLRIMTVAALSTYPRQRAENGGTAARGSTYNLTPLRKIRPPRERGPRKTNLQLVRLMRRICPTVVQRNLILARNQQGTMDQPTITPEIKTSEET
jgi:hypothetical protein